MHGWVRSRSEDPPRPANRSRRGLAQSILFKSGFFVHSLIRLDAMAPTDDVSSVRATAAARLTLRLPFCQQREGGTRRMSERGGRCGRGLSA